MTRRRRRGWQDGEPGLAEAAITETLRLHPPVPLGSLRRLRRPMTIAGWQLPAGATVASCSLLVHRRPDVYARPTEWQVDRFLPTRPPAGAWLPFGGGVRRCVGAAFAQFEARTVLDEVMRALELRSRGHAEPPDRASRHRDRPPARRPCDRRASNKGTVGSEVAWAACERRSARKRSIGTSGMALS